MVSSYKYGESRTCRRGYHHVLIWIIGNACFLCYPVLSCDGSEILRNAPLSEGLSLQAEVNTWKMNSLWRFSYLGGVSLEDYTSTKCVILTIVGIVIVFSIIFIECINVCHGSVNILYSNSLYVIKHNFSFTHNINPWSILAKETENTFKEPLHVAISLQTLSSD
jgi:hypothetical protein